MQVLRYAQDDKASVASSVEDSAHRGVARQQVDRAVGVPIWVGRHVEAVRGPSTELDSCPCRRSQGYPGRDTIGGEHGIGRSANRLACPGARPAIDNVR